MAQVHGTRNAGTRNIENPVAIPNGGITIFFSVTAVRPSRMRQASTAQRPARETTAVIAGDETNYAEPPKKSVTTGGRGKAPNQQDQHSV